MSARARYSDAQAAAIAVDLAETADAHDSLGDRLAALGYTVPARAWHDSAARLRRYAAAAREGGEHLTAMVHGR
ncbi:hypothetical protein [Streptomyces buecherae]|uniref:hypothetical protein n=1 Tax=Streptomyces buecherae TaxID=2763006 RepID=UPI0037AFAAE7